PAEIISKWVGAESGIRGVLIGTLVGSLTPSGPIVSMPLGAGLLRAGASVGTVVAFMTAWSLLGISRMPIEMGIMGWQFTLIRVASGVFLFPIMAGLIANMFFSRLVF
ncbi:MAG: permease, partial [Chloroflexota bacterium]|nr:permease [Chloroflexota bacterium]